MQIFLRALLYFWLLTVFSFSYFLVIELDKVGMAWFLIIWVVGALIMGWLGDAVLFDRGTVFGRNSFGGVAKGIYLAAIVLLPIAAILLDG